MNNEMIQVYENNYTKTVISEIKELINKSRNVIAMQVNNELLATYWKIGEIIVKYEQNEHMNLGKDFQGRIFIICGSFILNIQFSNQ